MELSICIPTYNRPHAIRSLLIFLNNEIKKITSNFQVEIIIGDNSTNDQTQRICEAFKINNDNKFSYIKNSLNIGAVNNILNLISFTNGNYIWIIGDDDLYHAGIISLIQKEIRENKYSYIFLNHRAYELGKKGYTGFESAVDIEKKTEYEDGKKMLLDIWNYSGSSMMFISACIYRNNELKRCINTTKQKDLAYPLYMSFYCAAQGKTKIIKQILLDNIWGTTSWSNETSDVFLNYVPKILYLLPQLGYPYIKARKTLFKYMNPRLKRFLAFQIKQIINHNLKLTFRYAR